MSQQGQNIIRRSAWSRTLLLYIP